MAERPPIILDTKDLAPFFESEYAHGFNLFLERVLKHHAKINQSLFMYETELEPEHKLPPDRENRLITELTYFPDWIVVDKEMLEELVAALHGPEELVDRLLAVASISRVITKTTKFLKGQFGMMMTSHKVFNDELATCARHLSDIELAQKSNRLESSYAEISTSFDSIRTKLLERKKLDDEQKELPTLISDQLDKVVTHMLYLQSWMASRSKSLVK